MDKLFLLLMVLSFGLVSCGDPKKPEPAIVSLEFRVDTLAVGLVNPWGMAFLPDGRILIAERPGRLRIYEQGQLHPEPIEGLPPIWAHGQGGLLDVVLHPDYPQNPWLYLAYAAPAAGGGNTAIARARLEDHRLVDLQQIFHGEPASSGGAHFGCRIVFDQDHFLFFAIGDRGVMGNAQQLSNHNGKVMRIHDDGRIPADNPFVNQANARSEIWSYGHRNIQGMIFDSATGKIWAHEHGPRGGDELNLVKKGLNYGWPVVSFGINYDGSVITPDTTRAGMVDPVYYWTPSIAPCGMIKVGGDKYSAWKDDLLIGALAGQHIHRLVLKDDKVVFSEKLLEGFARFRDLRQAPDGFIYVLTEDPGLLIRLLPKE